jgi:hypothetical protein
MKVLFYFLLIYFYSELHGQVIQEPDLKLPISLYYANPFYPPDSTDVFFIGLDSTATDDIDQHLGEYELPPVPPPGFPAVLNLPAPYNMKNSFADFRYGILPYTVQKTYYLKLCYSCDVTINWDLPLGIAGTLQDPFGGVIVNEPMIGIGSYHVTLPLGDFRIILDYNYYSEPGPVFSTNPSTINFPAIAIGDTITLYSTITNFGSLNNLVITDAVSSNPQYSLSQNSFPIQILPQASQSLFVTYTAVAGEQSGIIELFHNAYGSPDSIYLYSPTQNFAEVISDIVISSGSESRNLQFGLSATATDSIDTALGEWGPLPPFPPHGIFETRFNLPENNFSGTLSSYKDFRFAELPYSGQKEFRIIYQPLLSNPVRIFWDLNPGISGTLMDIINGTFINVSISDTGSFVVNNPNTFNQLRMLIDFNITTPVELIAFNASATINSVNLNWQSSTETNNQGFEIERSDWLETKSEKWKSIGFVNGNGTTTESQSYSFRDENVTSGKYMYRLKQIDFDGSFEYSNSIEVEISTPIIFTLDQNYPNPFNPSATISYQLPKTGNVNLKVFDVLGKEVATLVNMEQTSGSYKVEFNGSGLASGIYYYQLRASDFIETKKMILLK